jgi:hypothetical protein
MERYRAGDKAGAVDTWLRNVEPFALPDATHLLHVQNPAGWPRAWPGPSPATRSSLGECFENWFGLIRHHRRPDQSVPGWTMPAS